MVHPLSSSFKNWAALSGAVQRLDGVSVVGLEGQLNRCLANAVVVDDAGGAKL